MEIMNREEKRKVFEKNGFNFARMISGSKSGYVDKYPDHLVVFNARIYDLRTFNKHKDGKIKDFFKGQELEIWYGDIDVTNDIRKLYLIAHEIGTFIITWESGNPVITVWGE